MRDLIVTDLKRIIKDKLFLISVIIAAAFALFNPLLYKVMFSAIEMEDMLGAVVSTESLYTSSFALGNNLGLIAPIFITIILAKDFSYGTVRNKLISGKSRDAVYLSMFISGSIVMCGVMLFHGLLTLFISLALFGAVEVSSILTLILSTLFAMLLCIAVGAIISFFIATMKNAGLAVVLYFAVNFFFSIVGSITSIALSFTEEGAAGYGVLEFFNNVNIFISPILVSGAEYGIVEVLYSTLPPLVITAAFLAFGMLIFKKKNLK